MIIGKYIRQLLEDRKRVILPGFGNLEVKEDAAGVPTSGGRLDPPGLSIRFDSGFSKDDALIASALASGEKLSEEEAGQRVLEFVDAVKFALDKGEPYHLPDTGTFTRDDDGKVRFKPDPGWVLEPDQYGLDSMDLLELEELPVEEEVTKEEAKPEVKPEVSAKKPSEKPVAKTPEKPTQKPTDKPAKEPSSTAAKAPGVRKPAQKPAEKKSVTKLAPKPVKQERKINRWKVIWIVAASLIIVLIVLIMIPTDTFRKTEPKDPVVTDKPQTESPETTPPDAVKDESEEETSTKPDSDTPAPDGAEEEEPPPATEHHYFVIAGSFKHRKNASDLQDQMKARGFSAEVMVTENRMYRVSVASYATKAEAEIKMAGIKTEPGLESCWLLSNN